MTRFWKNLTVAAAPLLIASNSYADANDGDLLGYRLGDRYTESDTKTHDDGRLILIEAQNPVKPDSIESVYVLVTPMTRTIGKVAGETWFASGEDAIVTYERLRAILRTKYPDWENEEQSKQNFQATNLSSATYAINLQVSGPHRNSEPYRADKPFQLVLAIDFSPSSDHANEFNRISENEITLTRANAISEEESRGL